MKVKTEDDKSYEFKKQRIWSFMRHKAKDVESYETKKKDVESYETKKEDVESYESKNGRH